MIEAIRAALAGLPINWTSWSAASALALVACLLGYAFFQHSRDEFADAL